MTNTIEIQSTSNTAVIKDNEAVKYCKIHRERNKGLGLLPQASRFENDRQGRNYIAGVNLSIFPS